MTQGGSWNLEDNLIFQLRNPMVSDTVVKGVKTYNFQIFKGLKNVILSWEDAKFMLYHPVAKQFHKWQSKSAMPEETFFATLIRFRINRSNNAISQVI